MKKLLVSIAVATIVLLVSAGPGFASCMISSTWTPSPNAASEKLLVDEVEQSCPTPGKCDFIVPALEGQKVVIRSFNTQERYIDYEAATLDEESLSDPASGFTFTIICSGE